MVKHSRVVDRTLRYAPRIFSAALNIGPLLSGFLTAAQDNPDYVRHSARDYVSKIAGDASMQSCGLALSEK